MKSWLVRSKWKSPRKKTRPGASARPQVEVLEDRVTPALINHFGPILSSIQAQAVYLGSGWTGASIPTTQFDNFFGTTLNGTQTNPAPYLAMLKNGGFTGVDGSGSALASVTDNISLPGDLLDSQIQADLTAAFTPPSKLHTPNANTLYVVFVQPNVVVDLGNGANSTNTFLAYHSSFNSSAGRIRYAVVPYHGSAGNAQEPWLTSAFDSMTEAASHEIAESITDPDGTTWFDRYGYEIGDIVNGSTVYLNGYAVQREASIPGSVFNYLPMTPTGAKAGHAVTFSLSNGVLYVTGVPAANPAGENGKIVSISTQGIDDFGQPMIDVVFNDGNAYEYHDFLPNNPVKAANPSFFPWTSLGGGVKQAVAGQGVSYVLLTNGSLGEYVDPNYNTYFYGYGVNPGSRYGVIASQVSSITAAGTDQEGVNAVEFTVTSGGKTTTFEWRDVTGRASSSVTGFKAAAKSASNVPGNVLGGAGNNAQQSQTGQADALEDLAEELALRAAVARIIATSPPSNGVALAPPAFTPLPVIPLPAPSPLRIQPTGGGEWVEEVLPTEDQVPDQDENLAPRDAVDRSANLGKVPGLEDAVMQNFGLLTAVRGDHGPAAVADGDARALAMANQEDNYASGRWDADGLKGLAAHAAVVLCGLGGAGLRRDEDQERRQRVA